MNIMKIIKSFSNFINNMQVKLAINQTEKQLPKLVHVVSEHPNILENMEKESRSILHVQQRSVDDDLVYDVKIQVNDMIYDLEFISRLHNKDAMINEYSFDEIRIYFYDANNNQHKVANKLIEKYFDALCVNELVNTTYKRIEEKLDNKVEQDLVVVRRMRL